MLAAALARLAAVPTERCRVTRVPVGTDGAASLAVTKVAAASEAAAAPAKPLLLLLHGLGDTSGTFRFLAPRLADAGFDVYAPDLRGCGQSSTAFSSWLPEDAAQDAMAVARDAARAGSPDPETDADQVLRQRGVVVVAHSYSAASAVWMAAEWPQVVRALVFLGPFVRDPPPMSAGMRLTLNALLRPPIGAWFWTTYYRDTLHQHPALERPELATYASELRATLDAAHLAALRGMVFARKAGCAARLPAVQAPSLTVMGLADPDYASPAAEVDFIADALRHTPRAERHLVDAAGHYPHVEQRDGTADAVRRFLGSLAAPA